MKEFSVLYNYCILMFIGFNAGMIIFDYQHLINQSIHFGKGTINIISIIGILIHSCAILGTIVFGYFRIKEYNELEKDK